MARFTKGFLSNTVSRHALDGKEVDVYLLQPVGPPVRPDSV